MSVFYQGQFCGTTHFQTADKLGHLHLVRRGPVLFEHETKPTVEVREPALVLYPRPCEHRLIVPTGSLADLLCASIRFNLLEQNPFANALPNMLLIPLHEADGLGPTLHLLFDEASHDGPEKRLILDRLCEVLVVQLFRHMRRKGGLRDGILAGLADARLTAVLTAIHADPARAWPIEDMADLAHMSRTSFVNLFGKIVGMPPAAYLAEWRMGLAEAMLKEGRPVKEAALAIGYGNQPAFTRAFIARHGISPTEWLKRGHEASAGRIAQAG